MQSQPVRDARRDRSGLRSLCISAGTYVLGVELYIEPIGTKSGTAGQAMVVSFFQLNCHYLYYLCMLLFPDRIAVQLRQIW